MGRHCDRKYKHRHKMSLKFLSFTRNKECRFSIKITNNFAGFSNALLVKEDIPKSNILIYVIEVIHALK